MQQDESDKLLDDVCRVSLRSIAFVLLLVGKSAILAQSDPFLIGKGSAGRLHLGMTVDEFFAVYSRQQVRLVDLQLEGDFSPALTVRSNGHLSLTAEIDKNDRGWIVFRIAVTDSRFRTAEGIRVGGTFAQIKRAYPVLKFERGEGQPVAIVETEGLSFGLDTDLQKQPTSGSRITSILIFRAFP